jgi:hypothetical protein
MVDYCNPTPGGSEAMRATDAQWECKCEECAHRCLGDECDIVAEKEARITMLEDGLRSATDCLETLASVMGGGIHIAAHAALGILHEAAKKK